MSRSLPITPRTSTARLIVAGLLPALALTGAGSPAQADPPGSAERTSNAAQTSTTQTSTARFETVRRSPAGPRVARPAASARGSMADATPRAVRVPKPARSRYLGNGGPFSYTTEWCYDVNAKGQGMAMWSGSSNGKRIMLTARRTKGGGWTRGRRLTKTFSRKGKREYVGYCDMAIDGKGRATAVWTQSKGKSVRIMVATSKKSGRWGRPKVLGSKEGYASFPFVAVSPKGHAAVTWSPNFGFGDEAYDINIVASYRMPGGKWEAPVQVNTPGFKVDSRAESIVMDNRGVATFTWPEIISETQYNTQRVMIATHAPGGTWTPQLVSDTTKALAPTLATAPDGNAVLGWTNDNSITVMRRTPDGTWGAQETATTFSIGNISNIAMAPSGRVALSGNSYVSRNRQHFLMVQDAPGAAWVMNQPGPAAPEFQWPLDYDALVMAKSGAVAMTWEMPGTQGWSHRLVRRLSAAGKWGKAKAIGRFSMDAELAVDGRGRFSMVYGEGGGTNRKEGGCCFTVRAANLGR